MFYSDRSLPVRFVTVLLFLCLLPPAAHGQETKAVLTGYGTTGYDAVLNSDFRNDFSAAFTPIALFQMGDDLLFEGELDFELEGGATNVVLEHAQVHYLGLDQIQITAGKFHLPFGIWMHPTWVNKMPDPPLLYGHAHGGVPEEALLPILFDVGVKAGGKQPLSASWALTGALWVSQGPRPVRTESDHDHAGGEEGHRLRMPATPPPAAKYLTAGDGDNGHEHPVEVPPLSYGATYTDNNANKMIGGQLRLMNMTGFMVHLAGFRAAYDPESELAVNGANLSVKWNSGAYDFRGEGILLRQEFPHAHAVTTVDRGGYYLQATRRIGSFEPVIRWSHLLEVAVEDTPIQAPRRQLALGANYWMTPSMAIKLSYQLEMDRSDRILVQWAFGF